MASDQKRALTAVLLSALVLFTWQAYFAPKTLDSDKASSSKIKLDSNTDSAVATTSSVKVDNSKSVPSSSEPTSGDFQTKSLTISNGGYSLVINNDLSVIDMSNANAVFDFKSIVGSDSFFQFYVLVNGKKVFPIFDLVQEGSRVYGSSSDTSFKFEGELTHEGKFNYTLSSNSNFRFGYLLRSKAETLNDRQVRQFVFNTTDVKRVSVGDDDSLDGSLKWAGIDHHYHLFVNVFDTKQASKFVLTESGQADISIVNELSSINGYLGFYKKNYDTLTSRGDNLHMSIDFGIFGIIAVPILRGLQFFYKFIPNYGIGIILLTIVMRMITFPLQIKSFKSMKKMQVIQPELAKLKEKYKSDPQRMQKETMELFKKSGANPVGGCLPMLLQMPIFIAFYQVLYNAIELVNAPFYFWITDLSIKDPFYVLPVLMGIAMFGQTKLNPSTTADPTQQKVMMFMPIIFAFIMKEFPAGLNLYIFVSTLMGIIQQLFVYRMLDKQ